MSNNRILTELPKTKGNKNDYQAMVGMKLELEYEQSIYTVEIIDYIKGNHPRFKIEYNGEIKEIDCGHFMAGQFGRILNKHTSDFKVGVGEIFDNITVVDREYRRDKKGQNYKWYKYKCNVCGWDEGWIEESNLLKKVGCSCCSNQTVVEDINSIWTTDRWMCNLGLSVEDAKTHTKGSGDKVFVICPKCNKKKEIRISDMYNSKSIGCTCGDGFSYPERFMMNVLDQLNIEYIFQLTKTTFDWCENFKYDFYIPSLNTIIETHGRQHYEDCGWSKAKDVQENDKIKYELALQNEIKDGDYVVIDCRYSNKEWVKNNILSSKLNELFDLEKRINWNKCEEFALKSNIAKEVC